MAYEDYAQYPLNHARIGWHTYTREATWTADTTADGFDVENLQNDITASRWRADGSTGWVKVNFGEAKEFDYIGMAADNLGQTGHYILIEVSDNDADWEEVAFVTKHGNRASMYLFESITRQYVRITLTEGDGTAPQIGVVYVGLALEMPRPFYGGHSPITLSKQTTSVPMRSESGQYLGRTVRRMGSATTAEWQNLDADWIRQEFYAFMFAARVYGFFFAWNILRFPKEIDFCWAPNDIRPTNSGVRNLMNVSVDLRGLGDEC